jgi:hypothetical protein
MHIFRILSLCLLVIFQGNLYAGDKDNPCPMKTGSHAEMSGHSETGHDCCNDEETVAKSGELCKTGQECSFSHPYASASPQIPLHGPVVTGTLAVYRFFIPPQLPKAIWRPPALG